MIILHFWISSECPECHNFDTGMNITHEVWELKGIEDRFDESIVVTGGEVVQLGKLLPILRMKAFKIEDLKGQQTWVYSYKELPKLGETVKVCGRFNRYRIYGMVAFSGVWEELRFEDVPVVKVDQAKTGI